MPQGCSYNICLMAANRLTGRQRQMTTRNSCIREPIELTETGKILSQLNRLANSALLNPSVVEIEASYFLAQN